MADEQQTQPQAEQPQPEPPRAQGPQSTKGSFAEELTRLGRNFSELIKEALQSPQLQEIRKEVATSAQTVIEEVNEVVVKARDSQVTQEVAQKAAATVEEIKTAPVTENLKTGLLNTLRSVNEELSEIIAKMEQNIEPQTEAPQQPSPPPSAAVADAPAAPTVEGDSATS